MKFPNNRSIQMNAMYSWIKDGELLNVVDIIKDHDDVEVGEVVQEIQRLVGLYAGHVISLQWSHASVYLIEVRAWLIDADRLMSFYPTDKLHTAKNVWGETMSLCRRIFFANTTNGNNSYKWLLFEAYDLITPPVRPTRFVLLSPRNLPMQEITLPAKLWLNILSGISPNAVAAREILESFEIDINEAVNGVYLPRCTSQACPPASTHSRVHTNAYFAEVFRRLSEADSADEARNILQSIARDLVNGEFPF